MDPKHYILLNGLIVILLISSILFLRRGNDEVPRLNLRKSTDRMPKATGGEKPSSPFNDRGNDFDAADGARSLNVVFQYDGNWHDAFEILGIPAGTPLDQARAKFNELLVSASPERMEIMKAAIMAISSGVSK